MPHCCALRQIKRNAKRLASRSLNIHGPLQQIVTGLVIHQVSSKADYVREEG
jgi:hypothetical protein